MKGRFEGRVAVVTGSSRGIGRAIVERLAAEGGRVVVCASRLPGCQEVANSINEKGGTAIALQCDVTQKEAVERLFQEACTAFGKIDVLVNNAGITKDGRLLRMSQEDFDDVICLNLKSAFLCIQAAAKYMTEARYGRIVNIGSCSGVSGNFGQANYAASKAGLIGLTKTAALELAKYNVTVNCVAPGLIESEMIQGIKEDVRKVLFSKIPRGYPGTLDDVAAAVAYAASEEAGFLNGATINLNGGYYMQ